MAGSFGFTDEAAGLEAAAKLSKLETEIEAVCGTMKQRAEDLRKYTMCQGFEETIANYLEAAAQDFAGCIDSIHTVSTCVNNCATATVDIHAQQSSILNYMG